MFGREQCLLPAPSFVLAFGAMVGWGWIIQTGYWLDEGSVAGALLGFVLGGVTVVVIGLLYGELASAMPFVGGEHAYSMRAFGPVGSFVCTWAIVGGWALLGAALFAYTGGTNGINTGDHSGLHSEQGD